MNLREQQFGGLQTNANHLQMSIQIQQLISNIQLLGKFNKKINMQNAKSRNELDLGSFCNIQNNISFQRCLLQNYSLHNCWYDSSTNSLQQLTQKQQQWILNMFSLSFLVKSIFLQNQFNLQNFQYSNIFFNFGEQNIYSTCNNQTYQSIFNQNNLQQNTIQDTFWYQIMFNETNKLNIFSRNQYLDQQSSLSENIYYCLNIIDFPQQTIHYQNIICFYVSQEDNSSYFGRFNLPNRQLYIIENKNKSIIYPSLQLQSNYDNIKNYQNEINQALDQMNPISYFNQNQSFMQEINSTFIIIKPIQILLNSAQNLNIEASNILYQINMLIQILQQANKGNYEIMDQIQIIQKEIILFKEAEDLNSSIIQIILTILNTSDSFFKDEEAQVFLRLTSQIEYFRKFRNNFAVGTIYNNVGSIFLKRGYYFEALQMLSKSILYVKYQIQDFCSENCQKLDCSMLKQFCINQDLFQEITETDNQQSLSANTNDEIAKLLFSIFYRKRNYLFALQSFQENCDQNNQQQKNQEVNQQFFFWNEIKKLIKELIKFSKILPYGQLQQIKLQCHLSKCYFKLGQEEKSKQLIAQSENLLKELKKLQNEQNTDSNYIITDLIDQQVNTQQSKQTQENQNSTKNQNIYSKRKSLNQNLQIAFNTENIFTKLHSTFDNNVLNIQKKKVSIINQEQLKERKSSAFKKLNSFTPKLLKQSPSKVDQVNISQFDSDNCFNKTKKSKMSKKQDNFFSFTEAQQQLAHKNLPNQLKILSLERQIDSFNKLRRKSQYFAIQHDTVNDNIENHFQNKRNIDQNLEENYTYLNYLSLENLDLIVKMTKAEILHLKKNFRQSALILTNLLEEKKEMMSHFPKKIIRLIQVIFENHKLQSQQLNQICQQFNDQVNISIGIVFACNQDESSIFKSIQLASNVISQILTKKYDKLGIVLQNQENQAIQLYMQLTQITTIKNGISNIIQDIQQILQNKQKQRSFNTIFGFLYDDYSLDQSSNLDEEEIQEYSFQQETNHQLYNQKFKNLSDRFKNNFKCLNSKEILSTNNSILIENRSQQKQVFQLSVAQQKGKLTQNSNEASKYYEQMEHDSSNKLFHISMKKDQQFYQFSLALFSLNIQLIIFSNQAGNNFLEQLPEKRLLIVGILQILGIFFWVSASQYVMIVNVNEQLLILKDQLQAQEFQSNKLKIDIFNQKMRYLVQSTIANTQLIAKFQRNIQKGYIKTSQVLFQKQDETNYLCILKENNEYQNCFEAKPFLLNCLYESQESSNQEGIQEQNMFAQEYYTLAPLIKSIISSDGNNSTINTSNILVSYYKKGLIYSNCNNSTIISITPFTQKYLQNTLQTLENQNQLILNQTIIIPQNQIIETNNSQSQGFYFCQQIDYEELIVTQKDDQQSKFLQIYTFKNQNLLNLDNQLNDLTFKNQQYSLLCSCLALTMSIILLIVYSNNIKKMFLFSINLLIQLLKLINNQEFDFKQMSDLKESEAFFSLETKDLYQSVLQIGSILIYTSENYFKENEAENLIRLSKQIDYFSQLGNFYASGITCNNVGNILLKQEHYFEALEHFQKSIIYARYSIKLFRDKYPNSISSKLLADYCINSEIFQQQPNNQSAQASQKTQIRHTQDKCPNVQNIYSNFSEIKQQQKFIQKEDFYYQRMELLTTLFYRKRNYVIALQSFQEYCDENQRQKISKEKNLNHNFWYEIKVLFKELIQIARQLPYGEYQEIKLLTHLCKCYFKLSNFKKSQQLLQFSKSLLLQLESISIQHNRLSSYSYQSNISQIQQQKFDNPHTNQKNIQSVVSNKKQMFNFNDTEEDFQNIFTNVQNKNSQPKNLISQVSQKKKQIKEVQSKISQPVLLQNQSYSNYDKRYEQKFIDNSLCFSQDQTRIYIDQTQLSYLNRQRISSFQESSLRKNRLSQFFQQNNQEEKCLESFFVNKRRIQNEIQDQYLFMNYLSSETLDTIIKITEAEIKMMQENYYESTLILSSLLEQKQKFMSHFPQKIVTYIKKMFDKCKIKSEQLDQIYSQFNNQKTYHIGIIFACNQNPLSVLKSIELSSNLVSSVLINKHDKIGILYQNQFDNLIDLNFTLTNASVIKQHMVNIVNNLQQFIISQKQDSFCNFLDFSNGSNDQINFENKIYPTVQSRNSYKDGFTQTQIYTYQKEQQSFYQFNNEIVNYIQDSQNTSIAKEQYEDQSKSFDFQLESIQLKCQYKCTNSNHYKKCYDLYFQESQNQIINTQNVELSDRIYCNTQTEEQKESIQNIVKNETFYLSIKKVITNIFLDQIAYQISINSISNTKNKQIETHNKFILYQTDKVEIAENDLFNQLCNLLYNMNIQLIIFSIKKGNNFIEQLPEQIYEHQQKQIIRVFYHAEQIINYLKNNRNYFPYCQYPTIIQHF
ncbi:hypothetical protein ABPG74_020459 [Tetrahymena malaccensis]